MPAVRSITALPLEIPFKESFTHATATRAAMHSLWVEVRDENGLAGYGEGCPREYVTGESLTGALDFVAQQEAVVIAAISDLESLKAWTAEQRELIDAHPAAWCAVELALLDLFAKQAGVSVETLLGLPAQSGYFRYTAVIGDSPLQRFEAELNRYRQAGFRDFKIKLSGDTNRDAAKIATLRADGIEPPQVRADANNLWDSSEVAGAALRELGYPFFALEEPLQAGDLDGMGELARAFRCAIILDESATRADQLGSLPEGVRWIVNLRVSKMGGLLRSLDLAERAKNAGIQLIVGAHVGETSLLARAALTVVNAYRNSVVAQEGAFGTHLLQHDAAEPSIMFGSGGVLTADSLPAGAGFGLSPAADINLPQ